MKHRTARPNPGIITRLTGLAGPGHAYIAVAGQKHRSVTDSRDAPQIFIPGIKASQAGHLL